jgi:hypothetical protein
MKFSRTVGWECGWIIVASGCILMTLPGCGNKNPTTIPVQGRITYLGKPLTMGEVQFSPTSETPGVLRRLAIGEIDLQGVYSLSTFAHGDGVLPGEYAVTVTLPKRKSGVEGGDAATSIGPFVPSRYSALDKTPLKVVVPADASGTLQLDFELKDQ